MPARSSASAARGSAKKPSLLTECPEGTTRQHSRLLNTTSALWNSSATWAKGTLVSLTFIRFTSPVRIIFAGILAPSGIRGGRRLDHIRELPSFLLTPDADPPSWRPSHAEFPHEQPNCRGRPRPVGRS